MSFVAQKCLPGSFLCGLHHPDSSMISNVSMKISASCGLGIKDHPFTLTGPPQPYHNNFRGLITCARIVVWLSIERLLGDQAARTPRRHREVPKRATHQACNYEP